MNIRLLSVLAILYYMYIYIYIYINMIMFYSVCMFGHGPWPLLHAFRIPWVRLGALGHSLGALELSWMFAWARQGPPGCVWALLCAHGLSWVLMGFLWFSCALYGVAGLSMALLGAYSSKMNAHCIRNRHLGLEEAPGRIFNF